MKQKLSIKPGEVQTYIAYIKPEAITVLAGLLTLYLVITGWITVRTNYKPTPINLIVSAICAIALAAFGATGGLIALSTENNMLHGFPAQTYFVFGSIAAVAGVGDVRSTLFKKLTPRRIQLRHVWRMSSALLIAAASFFLGQEQVFPASVQGTFWLAIPVLCIFLTMIFWLIKIKRAL